MVIPSPGGAIFWVFGPGTPGVKPFIRSKSGGKAANGTPVNGWHAAPAGR